MTRRLLAGLAGVTGIAGMALAAAVWAAPVSAKPVGALEDAAAADTIVHKTHFCHRSCEWGPAGWHRHVGPNCVRVRCYPRAKDPHRCFVDRYGVRHCRW